MNIYSYCRTNRGDMDANRTALTVRHFHI